MLAGTRRKLGPSESEELKGHESSETSRILRLDKLRLVFLQDDSGEDGILCLLIRE